MQAVILAGGKGVRLKPITNLIPKPMVKIRKKPFLQYLLERLRSLNITKILLLIGYLGDQVESYFGNGDSLGLTIDYAHEQIPLGTAGALKNAEEKLEDIFLLLNGDTYLPLDYAQLSTTFDSYLKNTGIVGMLTVYKNHDGSMVNNMNIGKNNIIKSYNKNNPVGMTHIDAGLMIFRKSVLEYIPQLRQCSLEQEIFPKLISEQKLVAFITSETFIDIGTPDNLIRMEKEGILP